MRSARRLFAVTAAAALAVTLAACATSERSGEGEGGAGATGGTFVFGAAGAPDNFDPVFATDGETFRPARQMYDTLSPDGPEHFPVFFAKLQPNWLSPGVPLSRLLA